MDKDQIVNNLRNAIENNSLKHFEEQCKDQIIQIDTYIKVRPHHANLPQKLCKNNYMDFLQSLSGVNDLQANIKDLKTELTEVATQVSNIEGDYFQLAQKSMAIKQSYFDVSKSILDFKATRVSHHSE